MIRGMRHGSPTPLGLVVAGLALLASLPAQRRDPERTVRTFDAANAAATTLVTTTHWY